MYMMKISKNMPLILSAILIDVSLLVSLYLYIYIDMPEMMASHWDTAGEVNGYIPQFWGLFLMPFISVFLLGLLYLIPKIDPLKKNIDSFRKEYNMFIFLMILFFFCIHGVSLLWNLGYRFNMNYVVIPLLSMLFLFISHLLKVSKRNWFLGIRTPWTLSSDIVWEKTHRLASKLFKGMALVLLFGMILPESLVWIVLVGVGVTAIIPIVYSYFEYKKIDASSK